MMQKYTFRLQESFLMPVLDNGYSKVVHLSFPKGKVLERHKAPSDILVLVLSGDIQFSAREETIPLHAGELVSLEKQVEHSLTALADSVVVLILTPSPSAVSAKADEPTAKKLPVNAAPPQGAISPQLQSFVDEHAELVAVMNRAQQEANLPAYQEAGKMIGDELNQHFRYEEDILFPLLGKYIGTQTGPIAVMLGEHKIIRENYQRFSHVLNNSSEVTSDVRQAFQVVADILRTHIMKEDNVLFPMASGAMSKEDQDEVARRVEAEKIKLR